MALIKRPVKSGRILTKITQITRKQGTGLGATQVPIVVSMKRSHARLMGQQQMLSTDPLFYGVFGGTGTNAGKKFVKNIGGYRAVSFTFQAETTFTVRETTINQDGTSTDTDVQIKTISIGFPTGVSVWEVIDWVNSKDSTFRQNLKAIITPDGRRFPYIDAAEVGP